MNSRSKYRLPGAMLGTRRVTWQTGADEWSSDTDATMPQPEIDAKAGAGSPTCTDFCPTGVITGFKKRFQRRSTQAENWLITAEKNGDYLGRWARLTNWHPFVRMVSPDQRLTTGVGTEANLNLFVLAGELGNHLERSQKASVLLLASNMD